MKSSPDGRNQDGAGSVSPVQMLEEESEEFETFGGYVCGMMGTLPEDGSTFELSTDRMNIRVLSVADRCIKRMIVTVFPPKEETAER